MGWFRNTIFGTPESTEQVNGELSSADQMGASNAPTEKVIPELIVERVEPRYSADMKHMELWLRCKNTSQLEIEITKIDTLNLVTDPNRVLRPGETYEIRVYNNDTPTNDAYKKARIEYKITENGDYFEADYMVLYQYDDSQYGKFYLPKEYKLLRPIRDRY